MEELEPGLYERLLTEGLKAQLAGLAELFPAEQRDLRAAETPDRIAWHLSRQIERALVDVGEETRVKVGLAVAQALLHRLGELVEVDPLEMPVDPATVLHAILRRRPDGTPKIVSEPLIPLLDSTLLTNAPGEPNLWNQLRSEVESADGIDVVMAFIRRSGISPLIEVLKRHCGAAKSLRVLTTTYTGIKAAVVGGPRHDTDAQLRATGRLTRLCGPVNSARLVAVSTPHGVQLVARDIPTALAAALRLP